MVRTARIAFGLTSCLFGLLSATSYAREASPIPHAHRGGTLRLAVNVSGGTLDPQINYTGTFIPLFVNIYDGLVAYRKAEGKAGFDIVPDLADSLPQVSSDGRVWVFHLRDHIHFSNGQELTVKDVLASFRRIYRVGSPTASSYYGNISGAAQCLSAPDRCDLKGVTIDADKHTVTFRLERPDGEFLQKLAFAHAVILPADTPIRDMSGQSVPGTGPYRIASYDPSRQLIVERNPYFKVWNAEAQRDGYVDRITYDFGLSDEAEVTAVERGQYDTMLDSVPQDRLGEIGAHYTSQVHLHPLLGLYYLTLNVHEPPFNKRAVRQAINHAVDRHAMALVYGGRAIAEPLCQVVPSGINGADIPCVFGKHTDNGVWLAPDLERARALIKASGAAGQQVTLVVRNQSLGLAMGTYLRDMLEKLGFDARVRPMTATSASNYIANSDNHVQISLAAWYADFPSASSFLDALLGCENARLHSESATNASGLCYAPLQELISRAKKAIPPQDVAPLWRKAGVVAMEQSAIVPLIQIKLVNFVSARLGNYRYSMLNHMMLTDVWVRP